MSTQTISQLEKAIRFRRLHDGNDAFIIPNPWDAGTAHLLARMGFPALATTGAGYAFSLGLPDGAVGRKQMLIHLAEIVAATNLPVSADLENGFGHEPETVAETIRLAAVAGVVGGSIGDGTGDPESPLYPLPLAVERIKAAVAAARDLSFPFTLTARAENFVVGRPDLADVIRRLQAYEEAGADVLFAPGLRSREDIAAVVKSLQRPLNVIMGFQGVQLTLADLAGIGVRRVSVGGSLARAALGAFLRAGWELREQGTFGYAEAAVSSGEINRLLSAKEVE